MSNEPIVETHHELVQPQLDIEQQVELPVQTGAKSQLWHTLDSNTQGTSEASFSHQLPSNTVLDRRMYVSGDFTYSVVATTNAAIDSAAKATAANANYPLSPFNRNVAPSAFPIHQTMTNMQVTMDTVGVTQSMSELPEILRMYDQEGFLETSQLCPSMLDSSCSNFYNNATIQSPRLDPANEGASALPMTFQPNNAFHDRLAVAGDLGGAAPWANGNAAGVTKSATFTYSGGMEPLIHPFLDPFGRSQGSMCRELGVKITWNAVPRAIRVAQATGTAVDISYANLVLVNVQNVKLHFRTFARSEISAPLYRQVLPINQFQNVQTQAAAIANTANADFQSPVNNAGRMPYGVLLYCKKSGNKLASDTDHSLRLNSVTCYLGSASYQIGTNSQELYLMSLDNLQRSSLSYPQFYQSNRGLTDDNGVGSFCMLRFGKDIPLGVGQAPGSIGSYQISFKCNWTNATGSDGTWVQGAMFVYNDALISDLNSKSSSLKTTLLSASDIAKTIQEEAEVEDSEGVMGVSGGSFWKKLKAGFRKGQRAYKKGKKVAQDAARVAEKIDRGVNMIGDQANDMFY